MAVELWEPPFEVDEKHCNAFDEVDPYNPQNRVRGFINKRQGFHYGTLWITHVNDEAVYQVIPSAPKQHYPFDNKGVWKFPEHDHVEVYEKMDGTCIIGYTYLDADDNLFTTFKTRLRPFVGEGKFGNFKLLWDEMLVKYPIITKIIGEEAYQIFVFELYGKRNHHLIRYNTPLDAAFLFNRDAFGDYSVLPPETRHYNMEGFPHGPEMMGIVHGATQEEYIEWQEKINSEIVPIEMPGVTDGEEQATVIGALNGIEGQVWYFMDDGIAVQIKCKPEQVLDFHWNRNAMKCLVCNETFIDASGMGISIAEHCETCSNTVDSDQWEKATVARIPITSIYTTIVNAFENEDDPSHRFISDLLLEEYPEEMVHRARHVIGRTLGEVIFDKKLRYEVLDEYKRLGVNMEEDKGAVMRHMAAAFGKDVCGKIYRFLDDYVEEE